MLAPHDREDPEFSEIWLASEDFSDALELVRRQTMLRHKVRCDRRISGGAGHRRDTVANLSSSTNWNGRLLASAFASGPSTASVFAESGRGRFATVRMESRRSSTLRWRHVISLNLGRIGVSREQSNKA